MLPAVPAHDLNCGCAVADTHYVVPEKHNFTPYSRWRRACQERSLFIGSCEPGNWFQVQGVSNQCLSTLCLQGNHSSKKASTSIWLPPICTNKQILLMNPSTNSHSRLLSSSWQHLFTLLHSSLSPLSGIHEPNRYCRHSPP